MVKRKGAKEFFKRGFFRFSKLRWSLFVFILFFSYYSMDYTQESNLFESIDFLIVFLVLFLILSYVMSYLMELLYLYRLKDKKLKKYNYFFLTIYFIIASIISLEIFNFIHGSINVAYWPGFFLLSLFFGRGIYFLIHDHHYVKKEYLKSDKVWIVYIAYILLSILIRNKSIFEFSNSFVILTAWGGFLLWIGLKNIVSKKYYSLGIALIILSIVFLFIEIILENFPILQ